VAGTRRVSDSTLGLLVIVAQTSVTVPALLLAPTVLAWLRSGQRKDQENQSRLDGVR
jgi:hypothetical protein